MFKNSARPKLFYFFALAAFVATLARAGESLQFNIAAQPMVPALKAFAEQSNMQLLYKHEAVEAASANAVVGSFDRRTALEYLVKDTGLEIVFAGNDAATIRPKESESGAQRISMAGAEGSSTPGESQTGEPETVAEPKLEEVVVTGTHIHGLEHEHSTVPIETYSRADIDRRGYLSTQEFIRSLPQNFKGGDNGASEDGIVGSANGLNNIENASGVNLRGLGTSSTLVLLNGHRLAPSAFGSAVDVSVIPLSAIERVEVLTDGASSIYGSDAVGGVVNFELRRDYSGAETIVQAGSVSHGDRSQYVVGQTAGGHWGSGSALAVVQYDRSTALGSDERSFTRSLPQPTDLYPDARRMSGVTTIRQQLFAGGEVFVDALYSRDRSDRDYTQPNGQMQHTNGDSDFISAHAGLDWSFAQSWHMQLSTLYSEVDTVLDAFFSPSQPGYTNGKLYQDNKFIMREGDLVADGPLFTASGGVAKAAIGVSYRTEDFASTAPWAGIQRVVERDIRAGFVEVNVPIVGAQNGRTGLRALSFSAAVRYDDYSGFGSTTNPKLGVLWSPLNSLDLRASYGTSFHAPDVSQEVVNSTGRLAFTYPFASPNGGTTPVLVVGASPELFPEKARDITLGGTYKPTRIPRLTLSWNYYDLRYRQRLINSPFDTSALLKPTTYGPLITQFGSDAESAAYVTNLESQGFQFVDFLGSGTSGVRNAYRFALTNASQVREKGADVQVNYAFELGLNQFNLEIGATWIDEIKSGFCSSCTSVDLIDIYGQPLSKRARVGLTWAVGPWQLSGATNYSNRYSDTTATPPGHIASYTTFDLTARYRPTFLDGFTFGLNVINAFDRDPPSVARGALFSGLRYDSANADPLGRFVSAQITKRW